MSEEKPFVSDGMKHYRINFELTACKMVVNEMQAEIAYNQIEKLLYILRETADEFLAKEGYHGSESTKGIRNCMAETRSLNKQEQQELERIIEDAEGHSHLASREKAEKIK